MSRIRADRCAGRLLDHALLDDIPITSEADIDAFYREIDGD